MAQLNWVWPLDHRSSEHWQIVIEDVGWMMVLAQARTMIIPIFFGGFAGSARCHSASVKHTNDIGRSSANGLVCVESQT